MTIKWKNISNQYCVKHCARLGILHLQADYLHSESHSLSKHPQNPWMWSVFGYTHKDGTAPTLEAAKAAAEVAAKEIAQEILCELGDADINTEITTLRTRLATYEQVELPDGWSLNMFHDQGPAIRQSHGDYSMYQTFIRGNPPWQTLQAMANNFKKMQEDNHTPETLRDALKDSLRELLQEEE